MSGSADIDICKTWLLNDTIHFQTWPDIKSICGTCERSECRYIGHPLFLVSGVTYYKITAIGTENSSGTMC